MTTLHFIGIDVSKNWFDVALYGAAAKPERFSNSGDGFAACAEHFKPFLSQALVVMEATGGYETALLSFLVHKGIAVHRANPLQAKHFIRSLGRKAKTDQLDAMALATYAYERAEHLLLITPSDEEILELNDLMMRRDDCIAMRVAETNRAKHPRYKHMLIYVNHMRCALTHQIEQIEHRMDQLIQSSQRLQDKMALMTSVEGVGKKTALTLLGSMPELGSMTRRQAASLAGLAPHPKDSGQKRGYRRTTGGRAIIRKTLFMAAMSARQHHPTLKAFYENLIKNGKKPMVALTAIMRKIITIINAKIRDFYAQKILCA